MALRVILKSDYESYENALLLTGLDTLDQRRTILCEKFAKNCVKNNKMQHMFPLNPSSVETRNLEKYHVQHATTSRLADSAIPYMQRLLNL